MSTQKDNLIKSVIASITSLDAAKRGLVDDIKTFIDRGYASTDPITDADLLPHGLTLSKFIVTKDLVDNLVLFLENGEPAKDDYQKIINNLKRV